MSPGGWDGEFLLATFLGGNSGSFLEMGRSG